MFPKLITKLLMVCIGIGSSSVYAADLRVKVLSNTGAPLADMVVYALPLEQQQLPKNTDKLVIEQKNKAFAPYISVAQTGNVILFSNQDDITHHIYSVLGKNKFDFVIRAGKQVRQKIVPSAEEILMGCNIHDWMSGYYLAVDTPLFTKTDSAGSAVLKITQPGKYSLLVWHPQMQEQTDNISREVTVTGDDSSLSIQLSNGMAEIPDQENSDGFDYLSTY
ncbi:MAG: carboxypeptidase regulatory-like domain-containing protein [Pseudomonadales bacterium]|nr:carboxypeptidase regulatory-like domain-containing protein [Pseudomonadales bacterium]NRA15426.1 hypothetical protein [Oceanospirillaceae bacterium]